MSNLQVANTIIQQLGGMGKLRAMVGAHSFIGGEDFVQFSFKGSRKYNKCHVKLEVDDLYTFSLYQWKPSKLDLVLKFQESGYYWDMLKPVFESETGLYLSL